MIGVLTLFGEVDLQPVLKKVFRQNNVEFIAENCGTSVQLIDRVQEHYKETDVIIIAAAAVNMETFSEIVAEIRGFESKMRIILILNGSKEQYLEGQLAEYEESRIDVLYDDNGFNTQDLIDLVKQGKLSRQRTKEPKKQMQEKEIKQTSRFPGIAKKEKIAVEPKSNPDEQPEECEEFRKSFTQPTGKYTIGIFNATRGAGATTASINLARYFAMHGYVTKLADMTGTEALVLADVKDVEVGIGMEELDRFKRDSNILVMDFGTPYDITPKGDNFKISYGYPPEYIREINKCSLKILLGFSEQWQVDKIRFFLNNEQWREVIDDSYILLIAGEDKNLKCEYPKVNIMNRGSDYKDEIMQVLKEDEQ